MQEYSQPVSLRWSDMDPNFHVRHSVYYDLGAQQRTRFLIENGLAPSDMVKHNLGPILFREEALFKREIHFGDQLNIKLSITSMRRDYSRWTIQHQIMKGDVICAVVTVDGAWMDTIKRKLTVPPEFAHPAFDNMPKAEDFKWED